jgi:hypothetical protein
MAALSSAPLAHLSRSRGARRTLSKNQAAAPVRMLIQCSPVGFDKFMA